MTRIAITGALIVAAAMPAAAIANSVSVVPRNDSTLGGPDATDVVVKAAAGESNQLSMRLRGKELEVRDPGATLRAGRGCELSSTRVVRCALGNVGNYEVELGDGDDVLRLDGRFYGGDYDGGAGNDRIYGGSGYQTYSGGPGADVLRGGPDTDVFLETRRGDTPSADVYDGGAGGDALAYSIYERGITADLVTGVGPDGDRIIDVEDLGGGSGDDLLRGDAGRNDLSGGPGDDRLEGRGGSDALAGGAGRDELDGGAGADSLSAEIRADTFFGGSGDDRLNARPNSRLFCGSGFDRYYAPVTRNPPRVARDCEFAINSTSGPASMDVLLSPTPRVRGSELAFRARCSATCDAVLELRAFTAGRQVRVLTRSTATHLLPDQTGTLITRRPRSKIVVAVLRLQQGRAQFALRLP